MVAKVKQLVADNKKEVNRFLKFAVVGIIGAVVDFGILNLMHKVVGLNLILSNTISFTAAVLSNFTWNRLWTYPDSRSKPMSQQLMQFFVVNIVGWAINTGILTLLTHPLENLALALPFVATQDLAHTLGYNSAKIIATGVVMFWNFFINRLWTYNDVE